MHVRFIFIKYTDNQSTPWSKANISISISREKTIVNAEKTKRKEGGKVYITKGLRKILSSNIKREK